MKDNSGAFEKIHPARILARRPQRQLKRKLKRTSHNRNPQIHQPSALKIIYSLTRMSFIVTLSMLNEIYTHVLKSYETQRFSSCPKIWTTSQASIICLCIPSYRMYLTSSDLPLLPWTSPSPISCH